MYAHLFAEEPIELDIGDASLVFRVGKGGGWSCSKCCLELDLDRSEDITELDLDIFRVGTGGAL